MTICREIFEIEESDYDYVEAIMKRVNKFIEKHNIKRKDIISIKTINNYPFTVELYYYREK